MALGYDMTAIASQLGISIVLATVLFTIIAIWSIAWKLVALWKSARKGSIIWFVVLGIVNTVGILEILYIFIFSKWDEKKKPKKKK